MRCPRPFSLWLLLVLPWCFGATAATATTEASPAPTAPATGELRAPAPDTAPVPPRPLTLGEAAILGLVEGITEFLPVSSTGHLILTGHFLGLGGEDGELLRPAPTAPGEQRAPTTDKEAVDSFLVLIQGGAIAAVALLYWRRLRDAALGVLGRNPAGARLARSLILAFLPAAVIALTLGDWIKAALFSFWPVLGALVVGALLMLAVDAWQKRRAQVAATAPERDLSDLSPTEALLIGACQCAALWPGLSRSMMAIVGGYAVRLSPARAAEFSFLLGFVTLGAATAYEGLKHGRTILAHIGLVPMALGMVVACVSAALAVRWMVAWLTRHGLAAFAWYRLALAAILASVWWLGQGQ